jgi:hypothetical protein
VTPRRIIAQTTATINYGDDICSDYASTFAATTASSLIDCQCLSFNSMDDKCYVYYQGEMCGVDGTYITEKNINKEVIEKRKQQIKRDRWVAKLRQKRIQIRLGKAENKGLELLERMVNKTQMKSYQNKGFIDMKDYKGNICRIFKSDNKFLEVYENKNKIVISKDMTTIDKLNRMDEFILNGETFVLKKRVCTHHKNDDMPDVDGVISKIIHLRAGIDYDQFGHIFKHERSA